jgi:hypothetical protein
MATFLRKVLARLTVNTSRFHRNAVREFCESVRPVVALSACNLQSLI